MTLAEELRSRNFSIYGQWSVIPLSIIVSPMRSQDIHDQCYEKPGGGDLRSLAIKGAEIGAFNQSFQSSEPRMGVLCIVLCTALGISHLIHLNLLIIFGIICLLSGLTLIFVEIPLLLRICPTSPTFDSFIRRFTTNYMRAAIYGTMSVIQWLSIIVDPTSLIAAAVVLMLAASCYLIAGLKGQGFVGSKTLGGQGVAQMIV